MLSEGVRKSDCVARLGGDEFGILLERADEASALETAGRLVDMIAGCEFCFQGTCLPLSVAIGIDGDRAARPGRCGHGPRRPGDVPGKGRGLSRRARSNNSGRGR